MEAPVDRVRIQLEILVARLKSSGPHSKPSVSELVIRLDSQFPGGDVGCFCALLLNHMFLKPGEAFFMAANDPHAYLSGGKKR